jgi:hypothetical protein
MYKWFWWEIQKERDHKEDLVAGGIIISKWIIEKKMGWYAL